MCWEINALENCVEEIRRNFLCRHNYFRHSGAQHRHPGLDPGFPNHRKLRMTNGKWEMENGGGDALGLVRHRRQRLSDGKTVRR